MNLWNQLFINMCLLITPLLLYQVFWVDRAPNHTQRTNQTALAATCGIMMLLCMSFPFELSSGFKYDLRFIPIATCFLYAGMRHALALSVLLLLYRVMIGGAGMYMMPITIALDLVMLSYYKRHISTQATRLQQTLAGAVLGILIALISAVTSVGLRMWQGPELVADDLKYFSLFIVLHGFTMGLVTYIMEQIKHNWMQRSLTQQSEKMNVLSELAASFAHEIRNPMTVARGFVQMMNQQELQEEKRQIYMQLVLEELEKTQSIVNDYLSFAKPQLEAITLVDAGKVILQAAESLHAFAELRNVEVELHLSDKLMISANPEKFLQCIVNLCKNGIEAMPSGGKLQINGALQSQTVCIDIIDQGVGMTTEEISRLGNPFYSTRGKGTGLGMMVTYRVIQNIQGRIDVTSEVGRGTCFSLLIPSLSHTSYH
ncbi:ATP-binding protein [Paenibacillus sp. GD4]|uniref:ATP-binding protein n=1 Tax=Paenibacillus sp. GD4 TaxID=3068890 RepID=UPI002796DCC8|nr:ATP-binding protein [Paenibacillus sp. GD4]MDQ1912469.1 ATP-binding protein [Paenibacillus sp. GD4]